MSGIGYFWTTTEVALLRQHYETEGAARCCELLPNRTHAAINAKAQQLQLRAPPANNSGKRFLRLYQRDDVTDGLIREGYAAASKRGDIKVLAARLGRPAWWVQRRAAELGIARGAAKPAPWCAHQLEILERSATCTLQVIRKRLKAAGYVRTAAAIGIQLKRRAIDRTDPDVFSGTDLARVLGVGRETVTAWCTTRGLRSARNGEGARAGHRIHRRDVRAWLAQTRERFIDLRRVDQVEFWGLLFGDRSA